MGRRRFSFRWLIRVALPSLAAAFTVPGSAAAGQEPPVPADMSDETAPAFASPFLEPDHWAHDALRRLHGLALLPRSYDPSTRSLTRREAGWLLARARAAARPGPGAELAAGYRVRFAEEFPATAAHLARASAARPRVLAEGAMRGGARHRDGVVLARHWDRPADAPTEGVEPVSDGTDPVWRAEAALLPGPRTAPLAARVALGNATRPEDAAAGVDVHSAYAALEAGDLVLWAGRRRAGFGPAYGGTVLLAGAEPMDGAGLVLADGARLPGFLGDALGPMRLEVFGARLERSGPIDHPWFFGWRVSISPADGLRLAIDRAGMFGGENHPVPTTFGRVVSAVIGHYSAEEGEGLNFENGLASGELWWRLPRGAPPLSLYLEWGWPGATAWPTRSGP